jgi:hypothetical protein
MAVVDEYTPRSGKVLDSSGNVRNPADGIDANGVQSVKFTTAQAVTVGNFPSTQDVELTGDGINSDGSLNVKPNIIPVERLDQFEKIPAVSRTGSGDKFTTLEDIRYCSRGTGQIVVWLNLVSAVGALTNIYVSLKLYADSNKTVLIKSLPTVITGKDAAGWYPYAIKLDGTDPDQMAGGWLEIIIGQTTATTAYVAGVYLSTINNAQIPVV